MIDRETLEKRYGELGTGSFQLTINGRSYDLYEILQTLGHNFEDTRPIDACSLTEKIYAIRYCDLEDRHIVTLEFDQEFRFLTEHRTHLAEWMGEEEYQTFGWGAWCPWSL
ncbi:MAG: hypothetical protein ACE5I9_01735 [Candidatus Methylomirabilales bacterium]